MPANTHEGLPLDSRAEQRPLLHIPLTDEVHDQHPDSLATSSRPDPQEQTTAKLASQSSGGQAAAGSQRNCSPAQDCVKQDRRQPSQHRSAASAEGDKADSYGYGFDVSTQKWYPTIHVEGLAVRGPACDNEQAAQVAVIALYNEHHPDNPFGVPSSSADAFRPSAAPLQDEEYLPSAITQADMSPPTVKREGRGQGLVQYELEPQLPGRGAKLMRGYCYSRSKAGVGRWVVDVQVPGPGGIPQRKHKSGLANESESAALAKQYYCDLNRITDAEFQAEVRAMLARCGARSGASMSSKRKRASNGQPAAAADEDVTQVEEGARKRSRERTGGRDKPHRRLAELGNRQALPRPVLPTSLQSCPDEHASRDLVQQLWTDNALSALTIRQDRRPALRSTYVHGATHFATLLGIGFDTKAAVAEIDSYMKLSDAGKRYFLHDKASASQRGQGLHAAHELSAWALLGEVCGVVKTEAEVANDWAQQTGDAAVAWLMDQTASRRTGWPSQLAIDCSSASNLLSQLVSSPRRDTANCMLIELEDPATACPHIFCFTYRPLGRLVPLVLLDEVPSCPRFACEAPEHTAAHPHRLDQLASCAARARELLSPERSQQQGGHHRRQHAHQEQQPQQLARPLPSLHTPDPRARAPGKQTAVEVHVTAEKDSSPELVYTPYGSMFQQQASHPDLLQQPEGYAAHASGQPSSMQHLPGYQAAAEANAEQAIVTIQPEQQADGSPALRHGSNGNSSATFQPGPSPMQPGSGHTVAVIAPSASLTDVEAEMQALGEKLVEETSCVQALELMLQARMKATLKRGSEDAVDRVNSELRNAADMNFARLKLEQRRQNLAKIRQYGHGLTALVDSL